MTKRQSAWLEFVKVLNGDSEWSVDFKKSFWGRTKRMPNGCLEWTRGKHRLGYGVVGTQFSKSVGPFNCHRVAFAIANPKFEWGEQHILHSCDNPPCCDPKHLSAGDMKQNIRECIERGRFKFQKGLKGKDNPCAKLTDKDVEFINKHFRPYSTSGKYTRSHLASMFGVSGMTIYRIAHAECWTAHGGTKNKGSLDDSQKAFIRLEYKPGTRRIRGSISWITNTLGVPYYAVGNYINNHIN